MAESMRGQNAASLGPLVWVIMYSCYAGMSLAAFAVSTYQNGPPANNRQVLMRSARGMEVECVVAAHGRCRL
jgi:hypothetical protein